MTKLNDPVIRAALVSLLTSEDPLLRVRHEMGIGRCVADVVAVCPRLLHIYEIKSDRDGVGRLGPRTYQTRRGRTRTKQGQVAAYSAVADRVTLVVGTVLLEKALPEIPDWWGVMAALDEPEGVLLVPHRPALPNPEQNWTALESMLWRAEAQAFCERLGIARGVRGASRRKLRARLREARVPLEDLRVAVISALRVRCWSDESEA